MKLMPRQPGIGVRLGLGLAVVLLLTLLVVAINFLSSRRTAEEIRATADYRVSMALISAEAQTALLEMLMHLQAFLAQEAPDHRQRFQRQQARFEARLRDLARLKLSHEAPGTIARLRALQSRYAQWRVLPPQLFALTDDPVLNRPALRLLGEEGEIPINVVQRAMADMITVQARREPSLENTRLLSRMATFQGTFDALVGALRGYLNRPDQRLRQEFQVQRERNDLAWEDLTVRRDGLTGQQRNNLDNIGLARNRFLALPARIFQIVDSGRHREDLHLLQMQVEPMASELMALLDTIVEANRLALTRELDEDLAQLADARYQSLAVGLLAVFCGAALAYLIRRRVVGPLRRLDGAARRLADGDLGSRVPVESRDELGRLAATFNAMAERLNQTVSDLEDHRWELTALNMELEDRVTERTTALAEARDEAEAARHGAELANQAKSSFLANMSHELRTPLNGILGYAQILARDPVLGESQRQGVAVIQRSGDYLLTLINDVLDLAKIESDRVELEIENLELAEFLRGLVELFRMRAGQKGIEFVYRPLGELPAAVEADEKRLRQVLINLLSNAVKFTERGSVTLSVAHEPPILRFVVADSGVGIHAGDLPAIFEPFRQVGARAYRSAGTGLGLAITRQLVTLMGGELQVRSEPGEGSEFQVSLPLAVSSASGSRRDAPEIIGYRGERRRLLVVSADATERALLKGLLAPLAFIVLDAPDAGAGLSLARYDSPDLLLLDLATPDQSGLQLARRWRGDPLLGNIPVVGISASVFQHHRQAALEAGCAGFVPKPVRLAVLLDTLGRVLDLEWLAREVTAAPAPVAGAVAHGPDPERAARLLELAQQGDVAGIETVLEELAGEADLDGFVARARELVAEFQLEEIGDLARPYAEPRN